MSLFAGQLLVAGRVPGQRIQTEIATSDSSDFTTTEAVLMTLQDVPVIAGRTYRISALAQIQSGSVNDGFLRIRVDDTSGLIIYQARWETPNPGPVGYPSFIGGDYSVGASGALTLVLSAVRDNGSGNCRMEAEGSRPAQFYINYVSG